jgi:hypothetical protein|nr:MAG TPA: hypothetical protein [Caudoviricetes sp.]
MIKKHLIALFLNTGTASAPTWTRVKKSTELTISLNPETEDFDYIADENPTTELTKYAPSIEQPLKMIESEPDFEFIWNRFYDMKTGEDAKTDYMIVFMFDKTAGATPAYKAWKGSAIISCKELNAVDSEIGFDLMFGGTIEKGTATVTDGTPTFTATTTGGTEE